MKSLINKIKNLNWHLISKVVKLTLVTSFVIIGCVASSLIYIFIMLYPAYDSYCNDVAEWYDANYKVNSGKLAELISIDGVEISLEDIRTIFRASLFSGHLCIFLLYTLLIGGGGIYFRDIIKEKNKTTKKKRIKQ